MSPSVAVLLTALLAAAGGDPKPRIADLRVTLQGNRLEVGFELVDGFGEDLVERIRTGLPSGYDFQFRLVRDYKRWFDNDIEGCDFQVVAMYNAVTREYLLNYKLDGKLIQSRVVRDLEELRRAMTRFDAIPIFTLGDIGGKRRLLVKARAKLGSRTIFYFIPTTVTTDWVESRKFPPPSAGR